jgi:tetratricopeptide (TPR) repeat protein
LQELQSRAEKSGETVFARQIQMLGLELAGWNAHAAHDDAAAVSLLNKAIQIEGDTPKPAVTPAATLPASELLGDLLLELSRPAQALTAYQQSLQRFPRRFNSTLGSVRAKLASGDAAGAEESYCELLRLGASGSRVKSLDDLRVLRDRAAACK